MAHSHIFPCSDHPSSHIPAHAANFMAQGPRTPPDFPAWLPRSILLAGKSQGSRQGGMWPQCILCSPACAMRGSITLHKPEWKLAPQKPQTWLGPEPISRQDPHRLFLSLLPETGVEPKNYETRDLSRLPWVTRPRCSSLCPNLG